jgi:gelsolin
MALVKDKKINIADTNMALFGSKIEKDIKKEAANGEPAWKKINKTPGVLVWRVEKFKIVEWPKERYGQFYSGDSYIVLHTYKKDDKILFNVHFWLGEHTTLDEAGTAAYKTVELDDYLEGLPVQYREVQGSESDSFLKLFSKFEILSGGVETGFKHVEPEKYTPRLLHIKGKLNKTIVRQVPATTDSLNHGDVFILDVGLKVYTFQPSGAGVGERSAATQLARAIDDQRGSKVEIFVFGYDDDTKGDAHAKYFWEYLGGKKAIKSAAEGGDDTDLKEKKRLLKVSDASGSLKVEEVPFGKKSMNDNDVFIVDVINTVFVWIGKGASVAERRNGFSLAQSYLNDQPHRNKGTPIIRVLQGGENEEFETHFHH